MEGAKIIASHRIRLALLALLPHPSLHKVTEALQPTRLGQVRPVSTLNALALTCSLNVEACNLVCKQSFVTSDTAEVLLCLLPVRAASQVA